MAPPHGPINSCQICWQTHVLLIIIILIIGFETIIIIFTIGFLTIIIIISSIAIVILMLYLLRHIGLIVGLWELFIYPWWQPSVSYNELQWVAMIMLCWFRTTLVPLWRWAEWKFKNLATDYWCCRSVKGTLRAPGGANNGYWLEPSFRFDQNMQFFRFSNGSLSGSSGGIRFYLETRPLPVLQQNTWLAQKLTPAPYLGPRRS